MAELTIVGVWCGYVEVHYTSLFIYCLKFYDITFFFNLKGKCPRLDNTCDHSSSITRRDFATRGQLEVSETFGVVIIGGGGVSAVLSWVQAKDAAKCYSAQGSPPNKAPGVRGAEAVMDTLGVII